MEDLVSLADCPIGLFVFNDTLCLKTEYGTNDGAISAYIVSSGEAFWGPDPQTIENQRNCLVRPVEAVPHDAEPLSGGVRDRYIEILKDVHYEGWRFVVGQDGERCYMQVAFSAPDINTGDMAHQTGRKLFLSPYMTKSEVVQTALLAVLIAVEHEARERFRYRGMAIFGPHHDVDDLWRAVKLSIKQDARAPMPELAQPSGLVGGAEQDGGYGDQSL